MTERTRALVEKKLAAVTTEISHGADPVELARLTADLFPLITDRRHAHACIEAAYVGYHKANPDLEIEVTTKPFVREF